MVRCYDSHDDQDTDYYPCSPDGDLELAQCCSPGDSCASNGLCVDSSNDDLLMSYFFYGCTVAGWVANETVRPATCLAECVGIGVGVKDCGTGAFCCYGYSYADCDCSDSSVVFTLADTEIVTGIAADIASSSSALSSILDSTTSSALSTETVQLSGGTSRSATTTGLPSATVAYTIRSSAMTSSSAAKSASLIIYSGLPTDTELPNSIPASTASSSTTNTISPSSVSQLSTGLGAGIGVAVGITLIAIFLAAFCISWRRRLALRQEGRKRQGKQWRARIAAAQMVASLQQQQQQQQQHAKQEQRSPVSGLHELETTEKHELYAPGQVYFPPGRQELPVRPSELP